MVFDNQFHAQLYAALVARNHPIRKSIIDLIESKEMCVQEIESELKIEQSVVSQHLKWLRDSCLVTHRKEKKQVFYRTNTKAVKTLEQFVYAWANFQTDSGGAAVPKYFKQPEYV